MTQSVEEALARDMQSWEAAGLRRELKAGGADAGIDFSSNDYLGLARSPEIVAAARDALERHGVGGRASRLLGGGSPAHDQAEAAAAAWLQAERALLFPSGYQANLGLVTSLAGRGDAVVSDRLVHASLVDAARLSRARVLVHAHVDLDDLDRCLASAAGARRRLVLTEGVFSMDGDASPLAAIHALCVRHDAWLLVDEAHAVGLLGGAGAGAWAARGGDDARRLVARVVTGGKALGVGGAFVAGSRELVDHVANRARTFVYTTAPSPAVAGALVEAIARCRRADDARALALSFARRVAAGLGLPEPAAAIVPVVLGAAERAVEAAASLGREGFDVRAARPPTVPEGTSRLRVVCHAHNAPSDVQALVERLARFPEPGPRAPSVAHVAPRPLVVVGTDTDVGKTVVSALLVRAARSVGPVRYWKPAQTGADSDTQTVAALAEADARELLPPTWELVRPASPHEAAAAEGRALDPDELDRDLRRHRAEHAGARLLVELAGGLLVPYRLGERPFTQADWLARLDADVVLVARSGLGTLNHTLLTLEALRARQVEPRALFLVGEVHDANRDTLHRLASVPAIHEVPPFASLVPEALDRWVADHDLTPLLGD